MLSKLIHAKDTDLFPSSLSHLIIPKIHRHHAALIPISNNRPCPQIDFRNSFFAVLWLLFPYLHNLCQADKNDAQPHHSLASLLRIQTTLPVL